MAKFSLREKVSEMGVNDTMRLPRGFECITLRNYASQIGRKFGRRYSVRKEENGVVITRLS